MEKVSKTSQRPVFGWLIAPLAVLIAILANYVDGLMSIDVELNSDAVTPFIVTGVAGLLAVTPRILRELGTLPESVSQTQISLAMFVLALVGSGVAESQISGFVGFTFFVVLFGAYLLDTRERYEWMTMLVFAGVGVHSAFDITAAAAADSYLPSMYEFSEGQSYDVSTFQETALGFVFFTWFTVFPILGLLIGVVGRGVLNPAGDKGWFSFNTVESGWNRQALPLQIALFVWAAAHLATIWHFDQGSIADRLRLGGLGGVEANGFVGYYTALLTGILAIIVSGMVAERWFTRAMTLSSLWTLYLIGTWYEEGFWTNETFAESWAPLIWLAITFFVGVAISMIGNHEKYGGWSNREEHRPSGARQFWNAHWASLLTMVAFLVGFVIRIQWYAVPSMHALGTDGFDMTGGSDPWYMKRVVDYILAQNAHLVMDADRFYPIGGANPRPPLFSWSLAIGAMILQPFLGDDAVWWSMLALPAIYGALTILPVAAIAKDHFGKAAGVIAAWLIAFMPAHVTHSTWGLADHDSFVMLFIAIGFMFYLRAVRYAGSERLVRTTSIRPLHMIRAMSAVAQERKYAMSNAVLAGVAFAAASLGWKGFVVGPAILFLAYAAQVAINMFRRRDSTILSTLFLTMLMTNFLIALPFYAHPQLNLMLDGTGLQPFLFILLFTIVIMYITTGFRDKPWLLVLGTLAVGAAVFLASLYVLKLTNLSNAWDVLFTGGGYFTKTKIFGTVAEANAPDRGYMFASFGPIVFVFALVVGLTSLWRAFSQRSQISLVFAVWIFTATYMSWTAARFLFNATPVVAVMGAAGIVGFWKWANWEGLVRNWRRAGIRTPSERIAGARRAVWRMPSFSAVVLVLIMLSGQQLTYGLDSAIPSNSPAEGDLDESIYYTIPDIMRWDGLGFSVLDSRDYEAFGGRAYMGSFGSGFNGQSWNDAHEWLSQQDVYHEGVTDKAACDKEDGIWDSGESLCEMKFGDKPAFVSWWDYGFQALNTGQHPSVSDNFQTGIPASGNMLLARSQTDLVAMFTQHLAVGDITYNVGKTGEKEFTPAFESALDDHLNAQQMDEIKLILLQDGKDLDEMADVVVDHSFVAFKNKGDAYMTRGYPLDSNGIPDESLGLHYRVWADGELIPCENPSEEFCFNGDYVTEESANSTFRNNADVSSQEVTDVTHYTFGDYWYTSDLVEEYPSVSTHIHRSNAHIALVVQLLTNGLSDDTVVDLYHDVIELEDNYVVQDYNGAPGATIERDHEIRYFAIDDKLYPRAGRYNSEAGYNGGRPLGIFGAPTILSGQDFNTFTNEVYETKRGDEPVREMDREAVDDAMLKDILDQQSGAEIQPLTVQDIRIDHLPEFFDTMLARSYVGYGASTLGADAGSTNPQPRQQLDESARGTSFLQQAYPLPGAMMNHFVIANWYDPDTPAILANDNVKVMKYYSGAEISGTVMTEDDGMGLPNARILIERDAFSGEDAEDLDEDTYWIPIGVTDADENGDWSFLAPAGRIRVSAFAGVFDDTFAIQDIQSGDYVSGFSDVLTDVNDDREVYAITAVLGEVANMTWLGETTLNVTGAQADRHEDVTTAMDIEVQSTGVSGTVAWSGFGDFDGEPLVETDFILRNIWAMTENYTLTTTNGSFDTDETRVLQGTGEVTFSDVGTFTSEGVALAYDFTGNFTREISDARVFSGNGTWIGMGTIEATWVQHDNASLACGENNTMPDNATLCLISEGTDFSTYLLDGEVTANGRLTSDGVSTLTKELDGETFEGTGIFEGVGTLNGTGLFIGPGTFSGDIVNPGSFYRTGLVPGVYNMIALMPNGREILLPDPVQVGIEPTYDLSMTVPASLFEDTLTTMSGDTIPNQEIELIDVELGEDEMIILTSDEEGNVSYGPMTAGIYYLRVDLDNDGYYELNQTMQVYDEPMNFTFDIGVPEMYDLTITLNGPEGFDVTGREVNFTDPLGLMPIDVVSDENGVVVVELPIGEWSISDNSDEDYILIEEVMVEDSDLTLDFTYATSVWVNGSIDAPNTAGFTYQEWLALPAEEKLYENASSVPVRFHGNGLEFTAVTDQFGEFSQRLPAGMTFNLNAQSSVSAFAAGTVVTVSEGMSTLDVLILGPTVDVVGAVKLFDNNTNWNQDIPNYEPVEIHATGEDGVVWTTATDDAGLFNMQLLNGTWTFSIPDADYNADSVTDYIVNVEDGMNPEPVELITNPANSTVTFNVFTDLGDGVFENGTAIRPDIQLIPVSEVGQQVNITSADYSADGIVDVVLSPGIYAITTNSLDASDENATDASLEINAILDIVPIGLTGPEEAVLVPIVDAWRMNGTISWANGSAMVENFLLSTPDGSDYVPISVDENGSFATYVQSGDYIVVVAPILNGDGMMESLRMPITIDADSSVRTDLSLALVETIEVSLTLKESGTDSELVGKRVVLVSHDGYGNVTMNPSDADGNATQLLMPGTWSLYMNESAAQRFWTVDTSDTPVLMDANTSLGVVYAALEVEIGGKAYWDTDEDDIADANEGVEGANVTIQGGSIDTVVATDSSGVWRLYVPILENYTVTVSKDGFGVVSYDDNNTGTYVVENEPLSQDIEMSAAEVTVTGTVTDVLDASRLDGASITLYGTSENQQDSIDVIGTLADETLSFTAVVEPGQWVVVVYEDDAPFNGGGVAVGLLDAEVQDGGTIELVMSKGGWVDLSTEFTSFNLQTFNAGTDEVDSPVTDVVDVEVDLGDGRAWTLPIDSDGTLEVLLPANSATFNSEFSTVQRDLVMNYTAGISIDNGDEGRTAVMLSFNRKTNSDLTLTVSGVEGATVLGDENRDLLAVINSSDSDNYTSIEFDVAAQYQGTEIADPFDVSGTVTVSPDQDQWAVEFYNGTDWVESTSVQLGIGDIAANATLNESVRARIVLPSVEAAWWLENGHDINIRFSADSGDMTEVSLNVEIPQYYAFNTTDVTSTIGVAPGGATTASLTINNNGNGDDSFTYEVLDNLPDGWIISPMNGVTTIAKENLRDLAFAVTSSSDFDDGQVTITVRITSEDGVTQEDVEIVVESARISLNWNQGLSQSRSNNFADVDPNTVIIVIENNGLRPAQQVTVYLDSNGMSEMNMTLAVPASGSTDFEFVLPKASQGITRYDVRAVVLGDDANYTTGDAVDDDFGIEYLVQGSEETSNSIVIVVIIALIFIILYFGFKASSRARGSGSRF
ncbi:MAG: STT3 domain-containing protein [Candidatus Poseidoniaceae archaeon]